MVVPACVYESLANIRYLSSFKFVDVSLSHLVTFNVSDELEPSAQLSNLSNEIDSPLHSSTTDINSPEVGFM